MDARAAGEWERFGDRLVTAEEVGELYGVSARTVLNLPLKQVRFGDRLIRYRLSDVYAYIEMENPNL
jgi:predicted DNA-binding transcriptional regulator AlpA